MSKLLGKLVHFWITYLKSHATYWYIYQSIGLKADIIYRLGKAVSYQFLYAVNLWGLSSFSITLDMQWGVAFCIYSIQLGSILKQYLHAKREQNVFKKNKTGVNEANWTQNQN